MSNAQAFNTSENFLLAALPAEDYQRLQQYMELVDLPLRQTIYDLGEPITHVYFPRGAVVSLVITLEDGSIMEAGMVGREGMAGLPALLSGKTKAHHGFVQIAGQAWRLSVTALKAEFDRGDSFQKLVLRYFQALFTQVAQTGVCNRFHTTEERLARWLLLVSDCVQADEFDLTQEFIAQMIGVRRAGVTVAAITLNQAGLLRYTRGHIKIIDRSGLEAFSCECYQMVRDEFAWLYNPSAT
ncbi:Crp/Fnr family transcriptional regulator [Phormidium sp. FACHB-592]|uniref:Crp/Fnr family transcriptional regulator n=1 Tax=Stenomitos frigidus AS-A4 TaxID=2933935 RepID=A0ABV0KEC2_9CYAN|nr:Crp/Fnr family transcriptional regulator [Phormidium sp. FACHB-592]MBD2076171.1 Crp/Fnr family transcriptional regulator [Phormidium sp. FACHB-592]